MLLASSEWKSELSIEKSDLNVWRFVAGPWSKQGKWKKYMLRVPG
jgi:hypothetical protein